MVKRFIDVAGIAPRRENDRELRLQLESFCRALKGVVCNLTASEAAEAAAPTGPPGPTQGQI